MVSQLTVRLDGVVVYPPLLDQDACLVQRIEDFTVKHFVAELTLASLGVAVFPWAAWFDEQGLLVEPIEPFANRCRCGLGAIVGGEDNRARRIAGTDPRVFTAPFPGFAVAQ